MAFINGVNTLVSIAVGIAGIAGFVLTVIDRRNTSRRSQPRPDSAQPSATMAESSESSAADVPGVAADTVRRRSGMRRLLLSPLVFLAAFLTAGLLAATVDDKADAVDLSAIVGWSVACSVTLAWVYFALKADRVVRTGRTDKPRRER